MGWSLPSAAELSVGTPGWWWQDASCNTEHLEQWSSLLYRLPLSWHGPRPLDLAVLVAEDP